MNRAYRRAIARRTRDNARHTKQSHRLQPQVCVLYVPDRGYVAGFIPATFRIVRDVEGATPFIDDEATTIALAFRETTGLRVTIRPYYCPHTVQ